MVVVLAFAIMVGVACVAASGRRLWLLSSMPSLEPEVLLAALKGESAGDGGARVRAAIDAAPEAEWERGLVAALTEPEGRRAPLVNEQLSELDFLAQQWQRVPRVCASIATSTGFLGATLALRGALADIDLANDPSGGDVNTAIARALGVAASGIAATSFCIALHYRARALSKQRLASADRLIERLEALSSPHRTAQTAPRLAPTAISGNIGPGVEV